MDDKRVNGRYFTAGNPFDNIPFLNWARRSRIRKQTILEPFAGSNSLIERLQSMKLCNKYQSFDIAPVNQSVIRQDTLNYFPNQYSVCVTNPPWLAKNSATVRGLHFPDCNYDDLYKIALEKCLANCEWVAALVPESYIRTNLFRSRLSNFISLTSNMFVDTKHPVGLALFEPYHSDDVHVWVDSASVGCLSDLEKIRPMPKKNTLVRFNIEDGNVGLIALDNTREPSIRFCHTNELKDYIVRKTGRHITKLEIDSPVRIKEWNDLLHNFRDKTQDVLMTSYRGIRKDGKYRRRCDWKLARSIINTV